MLTSFDILGLRGLLERETAGRISRKLRVVKEAARRDKASEREFDRLYESFSDLTLRSIVISSPGYLLSRPAMLLYELESAAKVQIELIMKERILVRGGIALGQLVKSWGLVFGSGLVKAYQLEKEAKYPRIIVAPELVDLLSRITQDSSMGDVSPWAVEGNRLLARDGKRRFVDYLSYAERSFSDLYDYVDFLEIHKTLIEERLTRFVSEESIRRKYSWMKRYHNATVRRLVAFHPA